MDSQKDICFCKKKSSSKEFMIQCDTCDVWFHGSCVGVVQYIGHHIHKYHCPQCQKIHGKSSSYKPQTNGHRQNCYEANPTNKPVQTGSPVFIEELKLRHFASCDSVIIRMNGNDLTLEYLQQNGFDKPIIVADKEGLDITVPHESFTVQDLERCVGRAREIEVIDVYCQTNMKMTLHEFVTYFSSSERHRLLNVLSLELSKTRLSELVEAPLIARELDWVNTVWPLIGNLPMAYKRPEVQKYCLIGVKDSYTDFHIDFGGTSVWYHVIRGQKIFYLVEPTTANLSLYQRWLTSSTSSETFFGDMVDWCYKCTINAGETLLIPTGWIHAVLTPMDSIVFGGNFLHSINIPMQLEVYNIEKETGAKARFMFPAFETINWFAADRLCKDLKDMNTEGSMVPPYLLQGVKALLSTLKQWSQKPHGKQGIPTIIDAGQLLKDLSKEIRNAERFLTALNPPKPERESTRKRKRPVHKDFIDFSTVPRKTVAEAKVEQQPIKLSMKALCDKIQLKNESSTKAPLKLTLPKPATYPYSTPLRENKQKKDTDPSRGVKKSWSILENYTSVKATENTGLKVKITKQGDHPYVAVPTQHFDQDTVLESNQSESIYDFRDDAESNDSNDDDDCLMIDESPKRHKWIKGTTTLEQLPGHKAMWTQSTHSNNLQQKSKAIKHGNKKSVNDNSDSGLPKNGIEELLKASVYTRDESPKIDDLSNGRTSPSTREAIAGMLSISRTHVDGDSSTSYSKKRNYKQNMEEGEYIEKVHQDDEFIYPSLDFSDDDEPEFRGFSTPSPCKRRTIIDETWSPKARVGTVIPKTDRPCREGKKKQSVEKGLEAAAAKRASLPSPKRPYKKKSTPKAPVLKQCYVLLKEQQQPSTSQSTDPVASGATPSIDLKKNKPKKGMATAKQRLGKILKIHKMYH